MRGLGWLCAVCIFPALASAQQLGEPGNPLIFGCATGEPFIIERDGELHGYDVDFLEQVMLISGLSHELRLYPWVDLLDTLRNQSSEIHVAFGALTITSQRSTFAHPSQPYYESGLDVIVPLNGKWSAEKLVVDILEAEEFWDLVCVATILFIIMAHLVFLAERKKNPLFARDYARGMCDAIYYCSATMTTVGFGDIYPVTAVGKVVGVIWMVMGIIIFGVGTGTITQLMTDTVVNGAIASVEDLRALTSGTVVGSTALDFLTKEGLSVKAYDVELDFYNAVAAGRVDVGVYDAPILASLVHNGIGRGHFQLLGILFAEEKYGWYYKTDLAGDLRLKIDSAILAVNEDEIFIENLREVYWGDSIDLSQSEYVINDWAPYWAMLSVSLALWFAIFFGCWWSRKKEEESKKEQERFDSLQDSGRMKTREETPPQNGEELRVLDSEADFANVVDIPSTDGGTVYFE